MFSQPSGEKILSEKKPKCPHCSSSSSSSWIEMGCGTSTLMSENADIQAKVRPIIRRRINDLKRRRLVLKDSTPSKKELLAGEDFDKISTNNDSRTPSSENSIKIVPVLEEEEEEEEKIIKECATKKEEITEKGNNAEESHNQPEFEENEDDDEGRRISPGSPSFRFYCIATVPQDPDEEDSNSYESRSESPAQLTEAKTAEERSASPAEADLQQREWAGRNAKGKMNRRFRSVIPKTGQVKSLLNVKSCYNLSCSGPHDKAHLLQEAVA